MRLGLVVALVVSGFALAACGSDSDEAATTAAPPAGTGTGGGGGETIEMSAIEFAFDPSSVRVQETGLVTFRVTNDGALPHALKVDGDDIEQETPTLQPGESAEVTVDLSREGSYELYCPVGDHRDQGMEGELIVGSGGGGAGTGTMDDDGGSMTSDDDPYDY
jgi:plastocyanin